MKNIKDVVFSKAKLRLRLINVAFRRNGAYFKIKDDLKRLENTSISLNEEKAITETEFLLNKRAIKCLTIYDEDYPLGIKNLPYPPFVLFYKGRLELLKKENLLYLSGDYLSERTETALARSQQALTDGSVLVTRAWLPFENRSIRVYQQANRPTIFITLAGITRFDYYLKEGISFDPERDLVISEAAYPVDFEELKQRSKATAKLCSGISKALIIFSVETNSGLWFLADRFLEANKEVFCFSGRRRAVLEAEEDWIRQGASRIDLIKLSRIH